VQVGKAIFSLKGKGFMPSFFGENNMKIAMLGKQNPSGRTNFEENCMLCKFLLRERTQQ